MKNNDSEWKFDGFVSPNFTMVPDDFFNHVAPRISGSEVKVSLYIIRHTFGFKKESDNISLSQMLNGIVRKDGRRLDHGAGLSKTTLLESLKQLEKKNVIYRAQQWDMRGACVATNYRLNIKGYTPGLKTDLGEVEKATRGLVQKSTTQYTVNNIHNVNVSNKMKHVRNILHQLEDAQGDAEHIRLIADDILSTLGDSRSERFYLLVARKVPEALIRRTLSELKEGGAESPAKVFTSRMMGYAEQPHNRLN